MFEIEDSLHSQNMGKFSSYEEALDELKKIAKIPFRKKPNKPPCTNWKNCERSYVIIEYDDSQIPWKEIDTKEVLSISNKKVEWKN